MSEKGKYWAVCLIWVAFLITVVIGIIVVGDVAFVYAFFGGLIMIIPTFAIME